MGPVKPARSSMDRPNSALAGELQPAVHATDTGVAHECKTMSRASSEVSPPAAKQQSQRQFLPKQILCIMKLLLYLIIPKIVFQPVHGLTASPTEQERCSLPQKNSTSGIFVNCFVRNVTDITSKLPNIIELYFAENNITEIDPNALKENNRLLSVTFTRNNLTLSSESCFIHSNTVKSLDISDIGNTPCLSPRVFECLPSLEIVYMLLTENCECTRELMREANKTTTIVCSPPREIDRRGNHNEVPEETSTSMSIPTRDPASKDSTTELSDPPESGISASQIGFIVLIVIATLTCLGLLLYLCLCLCRRS